MKAGYNVALNLGVGHTFYSYVLPRGTAVRSCGMQRIACKTPKDFSQALSTATAAAATSGAQLFLLFTGSKNASSGQSWCPDCVRAEPLIENHLKALLGPHVLLTCDVDREPYRTADYPYRTDPALSLRCVPTLMKWEQGRCTLRLNDSQCQNAAALEEFFSP